ncbi:MAG: hypothetical protein KIS83_14975 [Rubrivivax sp.]|nr:hypothetical protein [Rubrivivax sp.]
MNTRSIIVALSLGIAATGAFASAGAGAGEAVYEYPMSATSQASRADVHGALLQAGGAVHVSEATGQDWTPALATRSRDAVRAEAVAALASGEIQARTAEGGSFDGRVSPAQVPVIIAAR